MRARRSVAGHPGRLGQPREKQGVRFALAGEQPPFTGTTQVNVGRVIVAHAAALEQHGATQRGNGLVRHRRCGAGRAERLGKFQLRLGPAQRGRERQDTLFSGSIANGGGRFRQSGHGADAHGNSTYGGTTTIHSGVLRVDAGGRIGNTANPVYVGGDPCLSATAP